MIHTTMIYRYARLLLIIFFTGLVVLLWPDKGKPVVQLNKEHGPSVPDLAGLSLMFISWLISTLFIVKHRNDLTKKFGKQGLMSLVACYLFSVAGIIAGLNFSIEWILWVSVAAATTINILFIISTLKVAINKT